MTATKTLTSYTISTKAEHAKFTIRARDYNHAAQIASRKLNGRSTVARRNTGDNGKSGWFGSYKSDRKLGGLNSTGYVFHVM